MKNKPCIDPLNDIAFKKIFGSEPNKDLLIHFLNEVMRGKKIIKDLVYNKNEHHGTAKQEGSVSFDLLCTGAKGERFSSSRVIPSSGAYSRHLECNERYLVYAQSKGYLATLL